MQAMPLDSAPRFAPPVLTGLAGRREQSRTATTHLAESECSISRLGHCQGRLIYALPLRAMRPSTPSSDLELPHDTAKIPGATWGEPLERIFLVERPTDVRFQPSWMLLHCSMSGNTCFLSPMNRVGDTKESRWVAF